MSQVDILIHYRDELRVMLQCDPGVSYEISEEFAFFVNGYKFMPAYKAGRWDGRIRLYDVKTRGFYVGLLHKLVEWAKENGYTIDYADHTEWKAHDIAVDEEALEQVLKNGKFEPKWYQKDAVNIGIRDRRCMILSPTGSGKSYIMYLIIRYLVDVLDINVLITVPSKSLVEQLHADFVDYTIDDWDCQTKVHKLYGGKEKVTDSRVVISTWQTAWRLPKAWFSRYGAYICDEAHGADAKCISAIIDNLNRASFRIGLTGTLDGSTLHELDMQARFGPIHRVASTKQLMDDDDLAGLDIDCLHLVYPIEDVKIVKSLDYQGEIDFLISHPKRNKILAKLAVKSEGNTLMLFNYIERHGEILYRMLEPMCAQVGKKLYYISGKTDVDDRERIRQLLEKENNAILLASFGTFSTGINVKNLHNVIFCHPYKAVIKILQSIGRVLRKAVGKQNAKLIDLADDLSYTKRNGEKVKNTLFEHFLKRLKIYKDEKFHYNIVRLEI